MSYMPPAPVVPLPGSLTLVQFLQSVIAGVTGLSGTLVRPQWQQEPPKNPPSPDTNWIAFGINKYTPDKYAYVWMNDVGENIFARNELIEVGIQFYGPLAETYAGYLQDGLQIQENLDNLRLADMGFKESMDMMPLPDLLNQRWVNRIQQTFIFARQVRRAYPILSFLTANGTIRTVLGGEEYEIPYHVDGQIAEVAQLTRANGDVLTDGAGNTLTRIIYI